VITTPELIDTLVADARPVRRMRPFVRATCWLLLATGLVVLLAVGHGVRPDLALKVHQPVFVSSVAAALLTGILAAMAALVASVPGRSRHWLWLPIPAAIIWLSTVSYGCLVNWVSIGPEGLSLGESARCFATLVLVSGPLSLLMLVMLRHVARLSPVAIVMTGNLAVAAVTATALLVLHSLDATVMVLASQVGVVAMLLLAGAVTGNRTLRAVSR
jgi:hypothetical protein